MTVFAGAVDATFAAFAIDALYTAVADEPVPVRVIAKRPDTIVGFGETRIPAETVTFCRAWPHLELHHYHDVFEEDPDTAGPWTGAAVAAMEIGVETAT